MKQQITIAADTSPAQFKGEPLQDPSTWAQKRVIEQRLKSKKIAQLQLSMMPEVATADGQISMF